MENCSTHTRCKRRYEHEQKYFFKAAKRTRYESIEIFGSEVSVCIEESTTRKERFSYEHALTALHIAAIEGEHEYLQELIDQGANLDAKDHFNCTALHRAAEQGKYLCLKALLVAGSDCSSVIHNSCDVTAYVNGTTALHLAAKYNHINCVKELLNFGADFNAVNMHGHTSLYIAAKAGFEQCILAHLEHPRNLDILPLSSYDTSDTPLHFAANHGMVECVKKLLLLGFDIHHMNKDGVCPLRLSYCNGSNVFENLVKFHVYGSSICYFNDILDKVIHKNREVAKILYVYGAAALSITEVIKHITIEFVMNRDTEFLKLMIKCLPVLPRLSSLDIYSDEKIDLQDSILPDNMEFKFFLHKTNICIEVYEKEPKNKSISHLPFEKQNLHPIKEPLLGAMYNRVIKDLKNLEDNLPLKPSPSETLHKDYLIILKKKLWYEQMANKPFALQHYCRLTMRKIINPLSVERVKKLSLPERLSSYLLYEWDDN